MKTIILCIVLVSASALQAGVRPDGVSVLGAQDVAELHQDRDQAEERRGEKELDGIKAGDGLATGQSGSLQKEKAAPAKKPRLKFRDKSTCPC